MLARSCHPRLNYAENCYLDLNQAQNRAWFKFACFWVATIDRQRYLTVFVPEVVGRDESVAEEPGVAEHFQPVGVALAGEQFRGALADSFRPLAA